MKIFRFIKIILILVLLFSMTCYGTEMMALPVFEDGDVVDVDYDDETIVFGIDMAKPITDTDTMPWFPNTHWDTTLENRNQYYFDGKMITVWPWEDDKHREYEEYVTLLGWFKSLSLDEKVEIYNWWKNKDVDWKKIKSEPIKCVPYKESGNYIAELEKEVERLKEEIKRTANIPEVELISVQASGFETPPKPDAFITVRGFDTSEYLKNGRLKLDIEGEIYWIQLEK